MNTTDLGPLERATLKAITLAESVGAPALDAGSLLRCLPRYASQEPNLEAALADPSALGAFVLGDGRRWALRDRAEALSEADAAVGRAEAARRELLPALRGLAKLPWIEGVALSGAWALGLSPAAGAPLEVMLLAEGGRASAARAAFEASLRARGAVASRIRCVRVWDADAPIDLPRLEDRFALAILRPITAGPAWTWLQGRVKGLVLDFPQAAAPRGTSPWYLGDRLDGRLAGLRRTLLAGDAPVQGAMSRRGRRRLSVDRALALGVLRLAGEASEALPTPSIVDREAEVHAWSLGEAAIEEAPSVAPSSRRARGRRWPGDPPAAVEEALPVAPRFAPSTRRLRGGRPRPRRPAGAATAALGRRVSTRGSGSASSA